MSNNHNVESQTQLWGAEEANGSIITKAAVISSCQRYRYQLTRIWDTNLPMVMFVMLNPSKADAFEDDPTIRRCLSFAKGWGFGGIYVCNLFAYRSTNPEGLYEANNPFGDRNIWTTRFLADWVEKIVCAWGNKPVLKKILGTPNRAFDLLDFASKKLHYIDLSKDGVPRHPLYLKGNLKLKKFQDL